VGVPLYARKDAREPPAGPDPIITQSVVKSGGLESLASVWPAPVTTSRAWGTMMKSDLIDGKSVLYNYYSFLQVDVRPSPFVSATYMTDAISECRQADPRMTVSI
jgi:hypothetical protein